MAIPHILDHLERAKARLLQQFRGNPDIQGLISPIAEHVQVLEDALHSFIEGRALDTAVGTQLDGVGAIVGQPRNGQDDETYRVRIRARVLVNRSNGTVNELLAIVAMLVGAGQEVSLLEQFPASFELTATGATTNASEIAQAIRLAKAAGIGALWTWTEVVLAQALVLDSNVVGQRLDEGHLAGTERI